MSSLKNEWKQTGEDLEHALESLGKTIVRSVETGVCKATAWAHSDPASGQQEPPKTGAAHGDTSDKAGHSDSNA